MRVYHDGTDLFPLWFELGTDEFFCGRDERDARDTQSNVPNSGVSLETLQAHYEPEGRLLEVEV